MVFISFITWFSRPHITYYLHPPQTPMSWTTCHGVLGCPICPGSLYCLIEQGPFEG